MSPKFGWQSLPPSPLLCSEHFLGYRGNAIDRKRTYVSYSEEDNNNQNLTIMSKNKENPVKLDLERFEQLYPNEEACVKVLETHLWDGVLRSPVDGNTRVIRIKGNPGFYRDLKHRRNFSIRKGTVFEDR